MSQCNDVDLRRLRYFLVVAEELNYGRAARRLRIAGPSLSQQVKTLERELKVQLFERDRRTVTLTAAGAALVPQARGLLAQADEFARRARDLACGELLQLGLVDRCPADAADQASGLACVNVDSWVLPSHLQAARVSDGKLDFAICHVDAKHLEAIGLVAHLIRVDRLHAVYAGSDPSPVRAKNAAVLIDADDCTWWSWNHYARNFARACDALTARIEDGGLAGRIFFEHARRLGRPILNSPKGPTEPLPRDMVRRPVVEPVPLWTWSLIRRISDDRPEVRSVVEALTGNVVTPDLKHGSEWLPPNDPHHPKRSI